MSARYQHETKLAAVRPFDHLQPLTRQFTGVPWVHRAYVLNARAETAYRLARERA